MTQKLILLKICIMLLAAAAFPPALPVLEESGEVYEIAAAGKHAVIEQRFLSGDKTEKAGAVQKAAIKIANTGSAVEESTPPTQVCFIHSRFYFSDYLDNYSLR